MGPVEELLALNSFFRNPTRADRQTAQLRQFLFDLPPDEILILVTHYVNIRALTGRGAASGEVFQLDIGRDGTISVVEEVLIGPKRRERPPPQQGNSRLCSAGSRSCSLDGVILSAQPCHALAANSCAWPLLIVNKLTNLPSSKPEPDVNTRSTAHCATMQRNGSGTWT